MRTLKECKDLAEKLGWTIRIKDTDYFRYRVYFGRTWIFWATDLDILYGELLKYTHMNKKIQVLEVR